MNTSIPTIEVLLGHQDWVRQIARSLVADPSRADDVAQETILESITRPPRSLPSPRGWLFQVARNAARASRRGERRRRNRERSVARCESVRADPSDAAQRAEMHRRLVDELFELPEPYRSVLVLRYFEDLDAREIAAQLDRPLATVRTQLQRGLERLRGRLDERFGDRAAWRAALTTLFRLDDIAAGVAPSATGSLALWFWSAVAVAVIATAWLGIDTVGHREVPLPLGHSATATADPSRLPTSTTGSSAGDRRAAETSATASVTGPAAATGAAEPALRGRVIGFDGLPIPSLSIAHVPRGTPQIRDDVLIMADSFVFLGQEGLRELLATEDGRRILAARMPDPDAVLAVLEGRSAELPRTISGPAGRFELHGVTDEHRLQVEKRGWTIAGFGHDPDNDDVILVAGPGVDVHGRIRDETGRYLAGVSVSISYDVHSLSGVAEHLPRGNCWWQRMTQTDPGGSFELREVPSHPDIEVSVHLHGYRSLAVPADRIQPPVDWTLEAEPEEPDCGHLTGVVLLPDGSPADGARIVFGSAKCSSGTDGRFDLAVPFSSREPPLVAFLPDFQHAIVDDLADRLAADPRAGTDLVLRLGPESLEISGRVLDAAGEPMAGAIVTLVDGTRYGTSEAWIESWVGCQEIRGELTDARGRFMLRGLSERTYTLRARDERTMLVIGSAPIPAGTEDAVLRAPADALLPRLQGTLVDRFGDPIAGARVGIAVRTFDHEGSWSAVTRPDVTETDVDGSFVLENSPHRHVYLSISGTGVQFQQVEFDAAEQPLRIVAARVMRFSIQPREGLRADRFQVHDIDDEPVELTARDAQHTSTTWNGSITRPAAAYEVDDRGVTMVLYAGDEEVRRIPLQLRPGRANRIDL
ncbi:MAG: sigma-70 family RNA polymerase sigma factor [Planctomycetes bacterium]|nr:sigma-70 family RNA polymerase sigma factor [Planctomycetota bacterium]